MKIEVETNRVYIVATAEDTWGWAHRPNQAWPVSELGAAGGVNITLDGRNGDLLDVYTTGQTGTLTENYEGPSDELTAFTEYALQDAHQHLQVVLAHLREASWS